jgi:hypothetical protein
MSPLFVPAVVRPWSGCQNRCCGLGNEGRAAIVVGRRSRTCSTSGEESIVLSRLSVFPIIMLLQEEVGASQEEGVGRILCGDDGNSVAILKAQATKHVEDLRCLAHLLTDIAHSIE